MKKVAVEVSLESTGEPINGFATTASSSGENEDRFSTYFMLK